VAGSPGSETQRRALTTLYTTPAEISLKRSRQIRIEFIRKRNSSIFESIAKTAFDSRMKPRTRYAPNTPVSFFRNEEKGPWTRTRLVAAITCNGDCVTVLHDGIVDGVEFLDLLSSRDFPSGSSSIMDDNAFHESGINWNKVSFRWCRRKRLR
jgi:hypothetical protein